MYTLYGKKGSGSVTTQVALELIGAPYRVIETASWEPNDAFTELLRCADGLVGAVAIDALEAAGSLYRGRLAGQTGCPQLPLAVRRRPSGGADASQRLQASAPRCPSAARGVAGKRPRGGPGAS